MGTVIRLQLCQIKDLDFSRAIFSSCDQFVNNIMDTKSVWESPVSSQWTRTGTWTGTSWVLFEKISVRRFLLCWCLVGASGYLICSCRNWWKLKTISIFQGYFLKKLNVVAVAGNHISGLAHISTEHSVNLGNNITNGWCFLPGWIFPLIVCLKLQLLLLLSV